MQYSEKENWEKDYFHASIQSFKYNFQDLIVNGCPFNINTLIS